MWRCWLCSPRRGPLWLRLRSGIRSPRSVYADITCSRPRNRPQLHRASPTSAGRMRRRRKRRTPPVLISLAPAPCPCRGIVPELPLIHAAGQFSSAGRAPPSAHGGYRGVPYSLSVNQHRDFFQGVGYCLSSRVGKLDSLQSVVANRLQKLKCFLAGFLPRWRLRIRPEPVPLTGTIIE